MTAAPQVRPDQAEGLLFSGFCAALPIPLVIVDQKDLIIDINPAAELFLGLGRKAALGQALASLVGADSPLLELLALARRRQGSLSEMGVPIETARQGRSVAEITVTPLSDASGSVGILIAPKTVTRMIDGQLLHRGAARSVMGLSSMLAHEIKNPLSGIRGAAQLLEQEHPGEDAALARLIRDEVDRVARLIDEMESFSDDRPLQRSVLNIHEVLGHVRELARRGFAAKLEIIEDYDPSLPMTSGAQGRLVQLFLNLIKNAAEAAPKDKGKLRISTRYRAGMRAADPSSGRRLDLPLVIEIADNGPGIPDDLAPHLFEPFVSGKPNGKGLGLALAAKVVGDHGGLIEQERRAPWTIFRVLLPQAPKEEQADSQQGQAWESAS